MGRAAAWAHSLPLLPAACGLRAAGSGTNVLATSAMLKAGAVRGATGENAVVYNAARADVILGPIGILMANGIMGEVSPKMSVAISGSEAAGFDPGVRLRNLCGGHARMPLATAAAPILQAALLAAEHGPALLAIDGRCGSGKSTLAEFLAGSLAAG